MLYFNCDYTEGAHPRVLEKMLETNLEQTVGYGEDPYCEAARELIRRECQRQDVDVQFLVGGTQTNFTVIRAALRPYQGVLSPATGHINGHETGAVEATGHKENGALYTLAELEALSETCKELGLYLFLDGARLGYGLTARGSDVSLGDLARLCDVFYIGGTKCGALLGEAVVIANPDLQRDFRYSIKQNGGMLAKGRLLGLQFLALFEDDRTTSTTTSAGPPTSRPTASPPPAKRPGSPSSPPPPPTSSSPSSPTGCWPSCGRSTLCPYGPRWMRSTRPSACAPAGPPGRRLWTSSSGTSAPWEKSCEGPLHPRALGGPHRRGGEVH